MRSGEAEGMSIWRHRSRRAVTAFVSFRRGSGHAEIVEMPWPSSSAASRIEGCRPPGRCRASDRLHGVVQLDRDVVRAPVSNHRGRGTGELALAEGDVAPHEDPTVAEDKVEMKVLRRVVRVGAADAEVKAGEALVEENVRRHEARDAIVGADADLHDLVAVRHAQELLDQLPGERVTALHV